MIFYRSHILDISTLVERLQAQFTVTLGILFIVSLAPVGVALVGDRDVLPDNFDPSVCRQHTHDTWIKIVGDAIDGC